MNSGDSFDPNKKTAMQLASSTKAQVQGFQTLIGAAILCSFD